MRGSHLLPQGVARHAASMRPSGSGALPSASSAAASSAAGLASCSSRQTNASLAHAPMRHHMPFSTSSQTLRPQKTSIAKASVATAGSTANSSSYGQIPSFDLEKEAFAAMTLRESQAHLPPVFKKIKKPKATRKERRKAMKAKLKQNERKKRLQSLYGQAGLQERTLSPFIREDAQFRTFKPLTPSLRGVRQILNPHVHKGQPVQSLTIAKRSTAGRNHHGHVTVRGRGGGNRRRLRIVDFMRTVPGLHEVVRIERDPNRSAHLALIQHRQNKQQSYIVAPEGMRAGDTVESYRGSQGSIGESSLDLGIFRTKAVRPGNVLPLRLIPIGTEIHCISLRPEGAAKLVRSAGSYAQIVAFTNRNKTEKPESVVDGSGREAPQMDMNTIPGSQSETTADNANDAAASSGLPDTTHVQVRLQSGEVRLLTIGCTATIGRVSNPDYHHIKLGKAGRTRWMGRKPKVRGVAMNAVDHPHGGGRGKSKSNKHERSIYGGKTKGVRTRKPGTRSGNKMVVRERPRQLGKRRSTS